MALTLYLASLVFPLNIAVLFAMLVRLFVTGCLHEDGLADFLDGFGGGTSRAQILSIMKDSHIGTYGVTGLIFYFGLFYLLIVNLPVETACLALLTGDPFSKSVAAMIINRLPYARKEEESKIKTSYTRMKLPEYCICWFCGLLPLVFLPHVKYLPAVIFPPAVYFLLTGLMKRKIGGYTGDCCGALFLLCELGFYTGFLLICKQTFY